MVKHGFVVLIRNRSFDIQSEEGYNINMPEIKCKICSNKFYAKPNWIKRGWGKYCSRKCYHESNKKGKLVKCFICNKQIYKSRKALKGSKSKKYFCSKTCQTIWRNSMVFVGKNHSNWKDGEFTYKNILLKSNKKRICALCSENDVRILAAHHLDRNRKNNNIVNLIWLCHNCHFLIHHYKKEKDQLMAGIVQ